MGATYIEDEEKAICDDKMAHRLPTLHEIKTNARQKTDFKIITMKNSIQYNNFGYKEELTRRMRKEYRCYNLCFLSVCLSFILGLTIGIVLMKTSQNITRRVTINSSKDLRTLNSFKHEAKTDFDVKVDENKYDTVTAGHKYNKDVYPKSLTEDMKEILKDNKSHHRHVIAHIINSTKSYVPSDQTVLYNNVYWGPEVEDSMPQGYGESSGELWEEYVGESEVVQMKPGCGRMQNRLVIFKDGSQACVRYRQNTDQIQGEIFSFYVAKLMNLTNLAPSVLKIVDLKDKLWANVANDIATAQWNSNRAVVLTQYIPSLESATIPDIFKPANRHLNKHDVLKMSLKESEAPKEILIEKLKTKTVKVKKADNFDHIDVKLNKKTIDTFVELAQWSDLIIFDYLTANLDRIVNNLFNYQWNINIMDGPAHNLARKMDSGLLLFLDNESGLLHGYRLLKKYNVYHSLMLDNLCVFRRTTIDALKRLYEMKAIGVKLSDMFHKKNSAVIRDILPPLPEKNAKILHERIGKVLSQVQKCELTFSNR
ncbi:extracellular serine/threonine protein kinase four-jointed [Cydia amplana]|uniref:extracellular serine/threonine protein kinase four-jointed n=1 Tax=Cydia amplana TaxID=1869771 RepID=UPI002FE6B6EB